MDLWYALVDLLPFEWAQPGMMFFMKNALLAVLVITPLFGILSTMVDKIPNRGVITSTASRAFFIKNIIPGWAHSKGSRSTRAYQRSIRLPPFPSAGGRSRKIPERTVPPPAAPASAPGG